MKKINRNVILEFLSNKTNHNLFSILLIVMLGIMFKVSLTLGQSIIACMVVGILVWLWYIRGTANGIIISSLHTKMISDIIKKSTKTKSKLMDEWKSDEWLIEQYNRNRDNEHQVYTIEEMKEAIKDNNFESDKK